MPKKKRYGSTMDAEESSYHFKNLSTKHTQSILHQIDSIKSDVIKADLSRKSRNTRLTSHDVMQTSMNSYIQQHSPLSMHKTQADMPTLSGEGVTHIADLSTLQPKTKPSQQAVNYLLKPNFMKWKDTIQDKWNPLPLPKIQKREFKFTTADIVDFNLRHEGYNQLLYSDKWKYPSVIAKWTGINQYSHSKKHKMQMAKYLLDQEANMFKSPFV